MSIKVIPYIPRNIIVHLGLPSQNVPNLTVPFPDYVKNVASSEIYPSWEPAAIRANVLCIISYALNRVYTEFYPSQGYNFNITSTTNLDQKYTQGGSVFDSISVVVDEIFNSYIRRVGAVEPLATKFCNGTTSTCAGLSQWGSQNLALQGYNSVEILQRYYGTNIEIVSNAPVDDIIPSYPGTPLRLGSAGQSVTVVQTSINRIAQNYPALPKISPVNGVFTQSTDQAVRAFQRIFSLFVDGIVGNATWYKLVYLYVGVTQLGELVNQGQTFPQVTFQFPGILRQGDRGETVSVLQYMLSLLAEFDRALRVVEIDGIFGQSTTQAVSNYQARTGLLADGIVGYQTWENLYSDFYQLEDALIQDEIRFPSVTQGVYEAPVGGQYPGFPVNLGQSDSK